MLDLDSTFVPLFAAARYSEVVRDCLVAVKRTGSNRLFGHLCQLSASSTRLAINTLGPSGTFAIVPLPSGPKTRRGSSRNLVNEFAKYSAREHCSTQVNVVVHNHLVSSRRKKSQKFLSDNQRASNVVGTLSVNPREGFGCDARHVIFDDVVTSGATVREAFRVLARNDIVVDAITAIASRLNVEGLPIVRTGDGQ